MGNNKCQVTGILTKDKIKRKPLTQTGLKFF